MDEDVFRGRARPLPDRAASATLVFLETADGRGAAPPPAVRHAIGYAPFLPVVRRHGGDARVLATDLGALLEFLLQHRSDVLAAGVVEAAAVFLGNAVAVAHPASTWRAASGREVGTDARTVDVDRALLAILEDPPKAGLFLESVAAWPEEDRRYAADRSGVEDLQRAATVRELAPAPVPFVRPAVVVDTFRDEEGRVIPYGERWDVAGGPPDEAYSRVSHLERYQGVVAVAEALVGYLEREFDVTVRHGRDDQGDRTVDFRPRIGSPLRVTVTDFPGVRVRAGLGYSESIPSCGCDACDESPTEAVDRLESTVLAIVGGGLEEQGSRYALTRSDGSESGSGYGPASAPALSDVAPVGPWPPWPARH